MSLLELLKRMEDAYIGNLPNINEMKALAIKIGCSVEYKHGFWYRWYRWVCFNDCEYVLTHNDNDMRNYTA